MGENWKILGWMILITLLLSILYSYLKPYEKIEYYIESDGNESIESISTVCRASLFSDTSYRLCGDATSYYKNGQIKEQKHNHKKYYEYISYYENGQKRVECSFKTINEKLKDGIDWHESSIEPCIFYDENGQIYKKYGEGKIEKEFLYIESKVGEWPWSKSHQVERISYYDENGDIEKIENYWIGFPFHEGLLEKNIRTSDGMQKEYYFWDGTLGLVEYFDKEGKFVSKRIYETREYNKDWKLDSKTFYTEDGEIEKMEKYVYIKNKKLSRIEEYDKEGYITNIQRY